MTTEKMVTAMAGTFILGSLLLAYYSTPAWLLLTAFVGFNLLQSSFTGFCPAEKIFKKLGFSSATAAA